MVIYLPVKYVCRKCGEVLWLFRKVGQDYYGIPTPDEIIRSRGVCPRCKNILTPPRLEDIVISGVEQIVKPVLVKGVAEEIQQES
ncbi:MAG: hypothetical protein QW716_02930 [Desulfurococcaceae archaeon]|uniref:Uncharacterized protein n=1 Tax=Staphylothermus marinus TaxID=2280 RepID=A0A7C4NV88_STAMA